MNMGECPHGDHDLDVPDRALHNADAYGKSVLTITECCGKAVHLTPVRRWRAEAYAGGKVEDDWGNPIPPNPEREARVAEVDAVVEHTSNQRMRQAMLRAAGVGE